MPGICVPALFCPSSRALWQAQGARCSRAVSISWCNFMCRGHRRLPGRNHGRALPNVSPTALVRSRPVRFGARGDPEQDLKLLNKGAPAPRACPPCHCVSPAQPFPTDPALPTSPAGVMNFVRMAPIDATQPRSHPEVRAAPPERSPTPCLEQQPSFSSPPPRA